MQISAAIIEKYILFNTVKSTHDNVTTIMSMLMFSGRMITIGTIRKL